jgi:hypothetical protein
MALPSKGMDLATLNAIHEWMKQGNRVRRPAPNCKTLKNDTWQGSKVTVGFKFKELSDG